MQERICNLAFLSTRALLPVFRERFESAYCGTAVAFRIAARRQRSRPLGELRKAKAPLREPRTHGRHPNGHQPAGKTDEDGAEAHERRGRKVRPDGFTVDYDQPRHRACKVVGVSVEMSTPRSTARGSLAGQFGLIRT